MEHQSTSTRWWNDFAVWKNQLGHNMSFLFGTAAAQTPGQLTASEVWLLGRPYIVANESTTTKATPETLEPSTAPSRQRQSDMELWQDFRSRLWMSYRSGFAAISLSTLTSDAGWGCMIRSGQSMLANCLLFHLLGRDWRLGTLHPGNEVVVQLYLRIIKWFMDSPAPEHIFSIHALTKVGMFDFEVEVGQWYGPSTIANVISKQVNVISNIVNDSKLRLVCHVANDSTIYKDQVEKLFSTESSSVLVVIPIRLGTDVLNPIYYSSLQDQLKMHTSVGICGGRPNSALYFIGLDSNEFLHLDPHICQPCVTSKHSYTVEDFFSYHCDTIKKTDIRHVDPSLLVGHLFTNLAQFEEFCVDWRVRSEHDATGQIYNVVEKTPTYSDDFDVHSISEVSSGDGEEVL